MRSCSMYFRMWDRYTAYRSCRQGGPAAIRCRCRRMTICSTPKGHMLQEITVSLGGRVAEEEIFDDITTGASQDIKQATAIAKSMITKFGMSERLGLINYDNDSDEVFIGKTSGIPQEATEKRLRERSMRK